MRARQHRGDVDLARVLQEGLEGLAEEVHGRLQALPPPSLVQPVDQVRLHAEGQHLECHAVAVRALARADRDAARARRVSATASRSSSINRWIVQTESFYDARGRVYLELADATPAEAERGMAMLKKLVG